MQNGALEASLDRRVRIDMNRIQIAIEAIEQRGPDGRLDLVRRTRVSRSLASASGSGARAEAAAAAVRAQEQRRGHGTQGLIRARLSVELPSRSRRARPCLRPCRPRPELDSSPQSRPSAGKRPMHRQVLLAVQKLEEVDLEARIGDPGARMCQHRRHRRQRLESLLVGESQLIGVARGRCPTPTLSA